MKLRSTHFGKKSQKRCPLKAWTIISLICIWSASHTFGQETTTRNAAEAAPPAKWDSRVVDVFFPDARAMLVGSRPERNKAATKAANGNGEPQGGNANSSGDKSWSKLISPETLQDEIKSLGPVLTEDVKTQQVYLGGANKRARRTLSVLAAAFAIINDYDGDVKWKKQAAAARDLFARAGFNNKAATENTFKETKLRSDDLASLLRGETIAPPAAVEPKNDWSKVASLAALMPRFEMAQEKKIAPATASTAEFKKNTAQIVHEAEILAALAEIIAKPGMENAEDDKFRGFAKALQQSALDLRQAVNNANYESARAAAGAMKKACDSCHGDFR
jgi:hypothetical protein